MQIGKNLSLRVKLLVAIFILGALGALAALSSLWSISHLKENLFRVGESAERAEVLSRLHTEIEALSRLLYLFSSPAVVPEERERAFRAFQEKRADIQKILSQGHTLDAELLSEFLKRLSRLEKEYLAIRSMGVPDPLGFSERVASFEEELYRWLWSVQEAVSAEAEFSGILKVEDTGFGRWYRTELKNIQNPEIQKLARQVYYRYQKLFFSARKINEIVNSDLEDISGPLALLLDSEVYPQARNILGLFKKMEAEARKVLAAYEKFKKEINAVSTLNRQLIARIGEIKSQELNRARKIRLQAESMARRSLQVILLIIALSTLLFIGFVIFVPRLILHSIQELDRVVSGLAGTSQISDLTQRLRVTSQDETGRIAAKFNLFLDQIHALVRSISEESGKLHQASEEIMNSLNQMMTLSEKTSGEGHRVREISAQVREEISHLLEAMRQMSQTIDEISENATKLSQIAGSSAEETRKAHEEIKALEESLEKIRQVGDFIGNMAEQTNLLALNATIEASRAGEAGKGFAVVANEVKELARQTANSVEEISRTIEEIIARAKRVRETIEKTQQAAAETADFSAGIASSIEEQTATIKDMNLRVQEIDRRAQEAKEMGDHIAEGLQQNFTFIHSASQLSQKLKGFADNLQALIRRFRI